ncbi:MAG: enoyl-CoA hydratase/isomerase family protein [Acidimicrobiales bacterium]
MSEAAADQSSETDVVEVTQEGRVRTIRLNRPKKMNAISEQLAWAVLDAVDDAKNDDDTWIIGLTGTGRAFCAGLDLTGDRSVDHSGMTTQNSLLDDLGWVSRFCSDLRYGCDKPIVAGINGVAVGAGLSLALAADIRLMARSARLMAGYPRIGGSPDGGMSYTLSQLVGYEQAMRFLLENRTVEGDEAHSMGLVGEVVDDDAFDARFAAYCQQLAMISPITGRSTKRVVREATAHRDLEGQLRYELHHIRRAFGSDDGQEARAAFLEKRDPEFKGS